MTHTPPHRQTSRINSPFQLDFLALEVLFSVDPLCKADAANLKSVSSRSDELPRWVSRSTSQIQSKGM